VPALGDIEHTNDVNCYCFRQATLKGPSNILSFQVHSSRLPKARPSHAPHLCEASLVSAICITCLKSIAELKKLKWSLAKKFYLSF